MGRRLSGDRDDPPRLRPVIHHCFTEIAAISSVVVRYLIMNLLGFAHNPITASLSLKNFFTSSQSEISRIASTATSKVHTPSAGTKVVIIGVFTDTPPSAGWMSVSFGICPRTPLGARRTCPDLRAASKNSFAETVITAWLPSSPLQWRPSRHSRASPSSAGR